MLDPNPKGHRSAGFICGDLLDALDMMQSEVFGLKDHVSAMDRLFTQCEWCELR